MIIPSALVNGKPYAEDIIAAHFLAELGVPIFRCRLDADGNPEKAFGWQNSRPGDESHEAIDRWKPGQGLCAVTGKVFDVIDIDPRNGGLESWPLLLARLSDDPPEVFGLAATPSRGAHFWIASQGVAKTKLLKGIDLQAQGGFVFLAPTERPSKDSGDDGALRPYTWRMPIHWNVSPWIQEPSSAFLELPWDLNGSGAPGTAQSGRRSPEELQSDVLAAEAGEQRRAIVRLVMEYKRRGIPQEGIRDTLRTFLPRVPNFDQANPWYPARGGNPDKWINGLMYDTVSIRRKMMADATDEEMAGLRDAQPNIIVPEDPEETAFWRSRPVLDHIFHWSRARMASPWAVLGEAIAEAVCHTPPTLQLPSTIGGRGTLNLLIAIVGRSGSGKNAAANTAEAAFRWEGVMGVIDNHVPRIPLGSGEGLARSFGFNQRDKENSRMELVRTAVSVIVTIPEIDTFSAINSRSGSTISPELRKLYSGETLGFGWADAAKRIIIPKHSYRSCVIAGVQPGRGETILGDVDGGFAQRWLWLPATDPSAPDKEFSEPPVSDWKPPGLIESLAYSDGPYIMKVFAGAEEAIKAARLRELHGSSDDLESHALYTRLKVAAGLALLDGSDEVRDSDWELAGFVMRISNRTRAEVQRHLAKKAHESNVKAGEAEGIRREVADAAVIRRINTKIATRVLAILRDGEWYGYGVISNAITPGQRDSLRNILNSLIELGKVESQPVVNKGRKGMKYRRI